jgi:diguanylate cyclase (GGDEF)-like protein
VDITTLRVTLTVVAAVLLVLCYVGAYRPTRAPFAGWWATALLLFMLGSAAYLANGTSAQAALNPLGNALGVAGIESAWSGARSLRTRPIRWPWLLLAPIVAALAGALDDPSTDVWAGGEVFLLLMAAAFGATTLELVRSSNRCPRSTEVPVAILLARILAAASGLLTVFYAGRAVTFAVSGPDSAVFRDWFGSGPTTLLLLVLVVTVSFSMSSLCNQQRVDDLHRRAVYDALTGMMRAQEFRVEAAEALPRVATDGEIAIVAMVDLDHFKQINDDFGHAAGDRVLRAFGSTALGALGPAALCGRLGGEEFALVFPAYSVEHAERMLAAMTAAFQEAVDLPDGRVPTVSVGMVQAPAGASLTELLERADVALYDAKARGRSRVVLG